MESVCVCVCVFAINLYMSKTFYEKKLLERVWKIVYLKITFETRRML